MAEALLKKNEKPVKDRSTQVGFWRMIAWQSRGASVAANLMVLGFLSIYCTDTLKIAPALVGVLFLASRVFDGFTDLAAGFLVDRTDTRWGRGRPYEVAVIGVWLCTWLMFSCPPGWAAAAKCAWVFAMYVLVNAVFNTLLNASGTPYMLRVFARREQHVKLLTYGALVTMGVVVAVNISFPMLMGQIATSAAGWSKLIALYALPLGVFGLLRLFTCKETIKIDDKYAEKLQLKDLVAAAKINPYIFIILVMTVIANIVTNMGVSTYYFMYIVKDIGKMGLLAMVQIVTLPVMFVLPPLLKKFPVTALMGGGFLMAVAGYFVNFAALDNFILIMIGGIMTGVGNVPFAMLTTLFVIDCAEYNEHQGQPRLEGTISSLLGFATKVGSALGAAIMGFLLSAVGYSGDVSTATPAANLMIRLLYSLIPAGVYVLLFVLMRFYKLEKIMTRIRKEKNNAPITQAGPGAS